MQSDEFLNAYLSKGRMSPLVEQVAVYLVTNESIGVLGAMSETLKMQRESK
jgi:glucokinase